MPNLVVSERTVNRLQQVAQTNKTSIEKLAEQVIRDYLRREAEQAIDREIEAYRQMHQELLQHYKNEYVAVYQGQMIDHDESKLALYLRIQAEYPEIPVLIRQVRPEVDRIINMRSPRLERG